MKPNLLSALVKDEAATIRDIMDGLTSIDPNNISLNDDTIENSTYRNRYLSWLHMPFSAAGLRLTDDERHYIFSKVFGRPVTSAKELTDLEVIAWHRILGNEASKITVGRMLQAMVNEYRV